MRVFLFFVSLTLAFPVAAAGSDFVSLSRVDFSVRLDGRTFPGKPGRRSLRQSCLLRTPVAEALARAQASLRLNGYSLQVNRCFRPSRDTCRSPWDCSAESRRAYARGDRVDVMLLDRQGNEAIPSGPYGVHPERPLSAEDSRLGLLRSTLEREGFTTVEGQWWAYEFSGRFDEQEHWPRLAD